MFLVQLLDGVVENHLISADVADLPGQFKPYADYLRGRFMLVKKADMFPLECIVRGYLAGSGLAEYQKQGTVCGIELPSGLMNSSKLPEPIYTPSTKAEIGDHDENISFERLGASSLAKRTPSRLRDLAIAKMYAEGARPCRRARASSSPTPSSNSASGGRQDHRWPTRCITPDSSPLLAGRPATRKARTSPASTSSSCATG